MVFVFVLLAIAIGAMAQRVTGMGFALAVAPALVLLLGPFDGVLIVNVCAVVSSAIIISRVWRLVDWRRFALLVIPALVGIIPGSYLAATLPGPLLEVGVAVLLLVALTISLLVTRAEVTLSGWPPAVSAGFVSGFMNATAGVGGPAISIYAVLTRWSQPIFAATLQPYFFVVAFSSLVSKLLFSHGDLPALEWWQWVLLITALLMGLVAGELVTARISHAAARAAVIVIAYVGGVVALVHGILTMLSTG